MDLNLSDFFTFCDREVGLSDGSRHLVDGRQAPRISTASVFDGIFLMGVCGFRSLLKLDQALREKPVRALLSRRGRSPFSDSTAQRVVRSLDPFGLSVLSEKGTHALSEKGIGRMELSSGRRLRVALLDGTFLGGRFFSCLVRSGRIDVVLDAILQEKLGKELPASKDLIRRGLDRWGKGWGDILLVDALYFDHAFINLCAVDAGVDVLIKTDEKGLLILEDAQDLFEKYANDPDVEIRIGTDENRALRFEIFCAPGFTHSGTTVPLKVARVTETHLKGRFQGQTETFFVVTTKIDLSALEIRELAHHRWRIENNVFKALADKLNTKHRFAQDPQAAYSIARILFLAWNLLQAFLLDVSKDTIRAVYGKVKVTMRFLRDALAQSLWTTPITPASS